jgi:hypothetical protein
VRRYAEGIATSSSRHPVSPTFCGSRSDEIIGIFVHNLIQRWCILHNSFDMLQAGKRYFRILAIVAAVLGSRLDRCLCQTFTSPPKKGSCLLAKVKLYGMVLICKAQLFLRKSGESAKPFGPWSFLWGRPVQRLGD